MSKIKAVGNMVLDILAVPFGGPDDLDLDGEYFSKDTDLHLDKFPDPLVIYHHGANQDKTELIGKAMGHTIKDDGIWIRVKLDQASQYAQRVWNAAKRGLAAASSGSISHLVRKAKDGFISAWPLVELSLFDIDKSQNRQPANPAAVVIPAKSVYSLPDAQEIYKAAGKIFPEMPAPEKDWAALANDKDYIEGKALQEVAKKVLVQCAVNDILIAKAFDREPTVEEQLYEAAAIRVLNHFQNNERIKSCPVRITFYMPDSAMGVKLGGQYDHDEDGNPRIIISSHYGKKSEYRIFLHELGHCLDEKIRGMDEFYSQPYASKTTAREDQADYYRDLIGTAAFEWARRLFYGGKLSIKKIPVTRLLEALA